MSAGRLPGLHAELLAFRSGGLGRGQQQQQQQQHGLWRQRGSSLAAGSEDSLLERMHAESPPRRADSPWPEPRDDIDINGDPVQPGTGMQCASWGLVLQILMPLQAFFAALPGVTMHAGPLHAVLLPNTTGMQIRIHVLWLQDSTPACASAGGLLRRLVGQVDALRPAPDEAPVPSPLLRAPGGRCARPGAVAIALPRRPVPPQTVWPCLQCISATQCILAHFHMCDSKRALGHTIKAMLVLQVRAVDHGMLKSGSSFGRALKNMQGLGAASCGWC